MSTGALPVSPLAPPGGFPDLPGIGGVRLAAAETGLRKSGGPDVMLAEIADGASLAGVFTRSATRSDPVRWCETVLTAHREHATPGGHAIVVNAGNANAFTGEAGLITVRQTAGAAAGALEIPPGNVFIASTGVIGETLAPDRIVDALNGLAERLDPRAWPDAARAIMTTDTYPKGASATVVLDGVEVQIAGIAKGSGMIAPDMATMLAFVFTDAGIDRAMLQGLLAEANAASFNCITVDGDTSTSDTVLLAATGQAAMPSIARRDDPRYARFAAALLEVLKDLAQQIVRDGEGASKFVTVRTTGAATSADARLVALSIANSPLVKTAVAGEDPNWGRIVMAVGKSGAEADRDRLRISFGPIEVARDGRSAPGYNEADAAAYMKRDEIEITVNLGLGSCQAVIWTCDLTDRYISINADYRS